ncbi:MAG: CinA family nicotinamide mononucleotide deamidase-related protein [Pirellulales bacterium]
MLVHQAPPVGYQLAARVIAEIISIGDELASGQRLDTNSQWLSQRLGEIGIPVVYHTTVADDLEANVDVFRQAARRADLVISTGGLGPTADDLTREALARVSGCPLVLDPESLAHIRGLFARRRREMPERNVVQAMFPAGGRVLPNPHGTAPGIDLTLDPPLGRPSRIVALPGVPAEMHEMWSATLAPMLAELSGGGRVIRHRRVKCFGVGESDLEKMLPDLIRRGRTPSVGITVSDATITLRITACGANDEECQALMGPTLATIEECLGSLVYGFEDDELEHAVTDLLKRQNLTLATAEAGTAGLVADWLGDVPEPGGRFLGGLVLPTRAALVQAGGVSEELIERHGPASAEVARAMAAACRERLHSDYALATSDFPAFDPRAAEPNRLFVALAAKDAVTVKSFVFAGHPEILKRRAAKQALNALRLLLLSDSTTPNR